MNNQAKIEAIKSFYEQGKEYYNKQNLIESKNAFIKAASLANEISIESSSYNVKMEYHNLAEKILVFLKNGFNKPVVAVSNEETVESKIEANVVTEENKITFTDVAGLQNVKDEIIYNVIEPLKNPELAKKYKIVPGAKIILYGPPGTGKTFIARAIAGEVDAKFYAVNCQDLISKYMGESSKQIDSLFNEAEKNKRAIIFFDEFDSIASKREDSNGVDSEMNRVVATLLTKVDGFKKPDTCEMLLLIAATNRFESIDKAMLRGGRFDTHIYVGYPDIEAIKFLVNKEFKDIPRESDVILDDVANKFIGYGCADIVSMCTKVRQQAYKKSVLNKSIVNISNADIDLVISKGSENI